MKQILLLLTCLVALSGTAAIEANVTSVTDGDTFTAIWNGHTHKCRLANVDAPELKQSFGEHTKAYLKNLICGKVIKIDSLREDMYDRIIVEVKIEGKRLDSLMIRNGYVWQYTAYNREPVLKQCQELAMAEKLGLWKCGPKAVCPPWLYRKYNARNRAKYCMGCNTIFI